MQWPLSLTLLSLRRSEQLDGACKELVAPHQVEAGTGAAEGEEEAEPPGWQRGEVVPLAADQEGRHRDSKQDAREQPHQAEGGAVDEVERRALEAGR